MIVSDHAHEDPNQADEENNGGNEEDFHRFDTEHIPPSHVLSEIRGRLTPSPYATLTLMDGPMLLVESPVGLLPVDANAAHPSFRRLRRQPIRLVI